jgi:hypothetical protein
LFNYISWLFFQKKRLCVLPQYLFASKPLCLQVRQIKKAQEKNLVPMVGRGGIEPPTLHPSHKRQTQN